MRYKLFPCPTVTAIGAAALVGVFGSAAASAQEWHDAFVFDACTSETLVKTTAGDTMLFNRQRHRVKAKTPLSLTIRSPKLFTSYRVLVDQDVVPDALQVVQNIGQSPSVEEPAALLAQGLPSNQAGVEHQLELASVEQVLQDFAAPHSARQLVLQLRTDRESLVVAAQTILSLVSTLYEAADRLYGEETASDLPLTVAPLRAKVLALRAQVVEEPATDSCDLPEGERGPVTAKERREIREAVHGTNRLMAAYQDLVRRMEAFESNDFFGAVTTNVRVFDNVVRTYVDNLRAHESAVRGLREVLHDDAARLLNGEVSERQRNWLTSYLPALGDEIDAGQAFVGAVTLAGCRDCGDRKPTASGDAPGDASGTASGLALLRVARDRLRDDVGLASAHVTGCCGTGPDLREAVRAAAARTRKARMAMRRELSGLNTDVAGLVGAINSVLAKRRDQDVELSLGVYNTNAVVTYRLFEQPGFEPYELRSSESMLLGALGGGVPENATGAERAEDAGEHFHFLNAETFEVHRTYRLTAFGAFGATLRNSEDYAVRMRPKVDQEGNEVSGETIQVAAPIGASNGELSFILGAKYYLCERDTFPGADEGRCAAVVFGAPVKSTRGLVLGLSYEPKWGIDVVAGVQWRAVEKLHSDIEPNVTPLQPNSDGTFMVPIHERLRWRDVDVFVGASFNINVFSKLFGEITSVRGAF